MAPRAAALALAAILLAGCNDHSGSSAASSRDTTPAPQAARATGVKLVRVGSFSAPIYVTAPPGDTHTLFVVERAGRIRVVRDRHVLSAPFLDISSQVRTDSERGLLSMAFAPDYSSTGLFYVYYTDRVGDIHVREYKRSSDNTADPRSGRDLLVVGHRQYGNHDGGQLAFGPDGFLYAGIGDGGNEGDPFNRGQDRGTFLGKIVRIDPHGGARPQIWAYGLRNPYRFSFDRSTGDLAIGDVGQDRYEEVDFQRRGSRAGANFGWSVFEGFARYKPGRAPGAVFPAFVTTHRAGNCAIIGGYIVRDRSLRSLYGRYVYGDLCNPRIYSARLGQSRPHPRTTGLSVSQLSSFGEDALGRVYAVSLRGGVYRLAPR